MRLIRIWLAIFPLALFAGCLAIPVPGRRLSVEEVVVGAREDESGRIVEQFVHSEETYRLTWIGLTCERLVNYSSYTREKVYLLTSESCEIVSDKPDVDLCDLYHPACYFPIPGSDRWIIIKPSKPYDDYNDITILVYSHKDGLICEHKIDRAYRTSYPLPWEEWGIDKEFRRVRILADRDSNVVWIVYDWMTGVELEESVNGSSFDGIDISAVLRKQHKLRERPQIRRVAEL